MGEKRSERPETLHQRNESIAPHYIWLSWQANCTEHVDPAFKQDGEICLCCYKSRKTTLKISLFILATKHPLNP